ncbi:acyltransferase [Lentilactobacillus sp. IMAU92037]|uniref:acyltransferase family protein n=1 Tax=Lentilactobacillus dabitei TaxID=2831523 RepID=UPI001C2521BC|nr:acyltransferase family protein [Lentilactobacillus dabitei]MBU9789999.1 acyltransferase [Lentilactobacillus dabitei]MBV0929498.1 acyltransferase [Lentilactobacillus dabitei]
MPESQSNSNMTDVGDYLKLFACMAVMLQTILVFALTTHPSNQVQIGIGVAYNLVKFTAPAFIFGILYTTIRTSSASPDYRTYLNTQWHALLIPTIWWTSIYLLMMPGVQQVDHYQTLGQFIWQFINGNAAPHLWYNTMMLQFIVLMPLFLQLVKWCQANPYGGLIALSVTALVYFGWLWLYDRLVFHGPYMTHWYLLDRFFLSFIIYGIGGTLTWHYHHLVAQFLQHYWLLLLGVACGSFYWINLELFHFGLPVKLTNAIYYKPSMTIYDLTIILLILAIAFHQIRQRLAITRVVHYLAGFAYKAFLSNVFWQQIYWLSFGKTLVTRNPIVGMIVIYIGTWILSFGSAIGIHFGWQRLLTWIKKIGIPL